MTVPSANAFIEEIHCSMASVKFQAADEICTEALSCYPDNLRLNILHGMILRHLGEKSAARDHFLALIRSHPQVAELELKLAELALANGDIEEAERRIEAANAKGGRRRVVLMLRADLARKKGDRHSECAFLEAVLKAADTFHIGLALRLANVYAQLEAREQAVGLLQRVLDAYPDNINAHAALAGVAEALGDGLLSERTLLRLIQLDPDRPNWYARAQGLYLHLGHPDKAEEILRSGLARRLAGAVLFNQLTSFPPIPDIADQVLQWARAIGGEATEGERSTAQSVLFHYAPSGFVANVDSGASSDDRAPTISDWLALSPPDRNLKRPVRLEALSAEVQISRSTTSRCVALVFLGLANRAMLPIGVFDRFFAALDISVLYIRDNRRLLGNAGIETLGSSFEDTIHGLRKLISDLGGQRCITVGSSAGGYPAIRYGLELEAEKILCFSGPTNLTAEFLANDGRGAIVSRRLQTLPRKDLDLKPHVINAQGRARIHLIYGDAHPQDSMHAMYGSMLGSGLSFACN